MKMLAKKKHGVEIYPEQVSNLFQIMPTFDENPQDTITIVGVKSPESGHSWLHSTLS